MKLVIENNEVKVNTKLSSEWKKVKNILSFHMDNYRFSPKYKSGVWDGRIALTNWRTKSFPVGLLDYLLDNITVPVEYNLIEPVKYDFNFKKDVKLYPYQQETFEQYLKLNKRMGIFSLAVNWGKSYLISKIIQYLSVKTIILVHRKTLVKQLYKTLKEFVSEDQIGLAIDGSIDIKPLTIGTIQTLKNINDYSYFDMIMVDEAHRASSKTYFDTLRKFTAYYRYGFTGTSEKSSLLENMKIKGLFGDVLLRATIQDTIELGKSAKPTVYLVNYMDEYFPLYYQEAYQMHIVENEKRNYLIKRIIEKENKSTLVMVNFIEHGEKLSRILNAPFLYGELDIDYIMKTLNDFNSGKIPVLIISTIGDEGLNIERADVAVFAGAGKSPIRIVQRIGRVLRKYKGKNTVKIYDFIDNADNTLLSHSYNRKAIYENEGLEIKEISEEAI